MVAIQVIGEPIGKTLYDDILTRREKVESGSGTFRAPRPPGATQSTWTHVKYRGGKVRLAPRGVREVSVLIEGNDPDDEGMLAGAFVGFIQRHFYAQLQSVTLTPGA